MSEVDSRILREQLQRRLKSAQEQALQREGEVSAETIEPLQRLARLVELSEVAEPEPPKKRWPVALLLLGTLAALSSLLFVRVSSADVELDLKVSEVRFRLPRDHALTDVLNLSALRVSGLKAAQLPPEVGGSGKGFVPSESIVLAAVTPANDATPISLPPLVAPAGTEISLRSAGPPGQFRLSLENFKKELRIDLVGSVRVGHSSSPVETADLASPRSVLLQPGADLIDLDLTLPGSAPAGLAAQIPATGLSFSRVDEFTDAGRTLVRRIATILSGTLYLESLHGEARELRAAEALRFTHSTGEIRALQLNQDHIALKFQGRVRGMSTGMDTARRSLMPSYLEWLKARHGLALLWGSTLYVFGLAIAVARWWGAKW